MVSEELLFGLHTLTAVLENTPHLILQLYILQERKDQRLQSLITVAEKQGIKIQALTRQQLDKLVPGVQHQGVIARCRIAQRYSEDDIETLLTQLKVPAFLLILDGIQDPHNLGACLRTANTAGVHMVIAPRDHSVGITPAVRKVASGAAEVTPFIQVTNLARTLEQLKEQGIWLYGMAGESKKTIYKADCRVPLALLLGAEEKGLRRLTRELCDELLAIPMQGTVGSLNVSVATGVCLYEVVRQRNIF